MLNSFGTNRLNRDSSKMKAVRRSRAVTALAASPADHIRVGSSDVQRLEHIQSCTAESRNMSAAQLVHLSAISLQCFFLLTKTKTTAYKMILKTKTLSRCWSNHSPGQTTPDVLSGFLHRLSGTRWHRKFFLISDSVRF